MAVYGQNRPDSTGPDDGGTVFAHDPGQNHVSVGELDALGHLPGAGDAGNVVSAEKLESAHGVQGTSTPDARVLKAGWGIPDTGCPNSQNILGYSDTQCQDFVDCERGPARPPSAESRFFL